MKQMNKEVIINTIIDVLQHKQQYGYARFNVTFTNGINRGPIKISYTITNNNDYKTIECTTNGIVILHDNGITSYRYENIYNIKVIK